MILDKLGLLDDAKAFTAGTTLFTDKIDLGAVARALGDGEPLLMKITIDVAAAGSTDTTSFAILTDGDAALGSPTVIITRTIANALLTAGSKHYVPLPPGVTLEQYLGGRIILGSGDSVTATVAVVPWSMANDSPKYYAKGYSNA
jgi:hypothetical protein